MSGGFSTRSAFTLVEVLAAIVVLVILMVITFGILGTATRVADSAARGGDNSIEALQVLDRIGADIAGMLIRPDIDEYFVKAPGNDEMFFYSQTAGYFNGTTTAATATLQSPISLVGYRISSSVNASIPPVLQRVVQGLNWSGSNALPFLIFAPTAPYSANMVTLANPANTIPVVWKSVVTDVDNAPSFWHTIGGQIFRFEICYQLRDGSFTLIAPTPATPVTPAPGTTAPIPAVPGNLNDTVGIVIAIAVLDNKSRAMVPLGSWAGLVAAFPDPTLSQLTSPAQLMDSTWNAVLNQPGFPQSAGIPVAAASQIRVYQRYYPLNVPKFQFEGQ